MHASKSLSVVLDTFMCEKHIQHIEIDEFRKRRASRDDSGFQSLPCFVFPSDFQEAGIIQLRLVRELLHGGGRSHGSFGGDGVHCGVIHATTTTTTTTRFFLAGRLRLLHCADNAI